MVPSANVNGSFKVDTEREREEGVDGQVSGGDPPPFPGDDVLVGCEVVEVVVKVDVVKVDVVVGGGGGACVVVIGLEPGIH